MLSNHQKTSCRPVDPGALLEHDPASLRLYATEGAIMCKVLFAFAILQLATAASAQDGRMRATSQASVRITVSVAPRAWIPKSTVDRSQLCVATGRSFEVVLQESSAPVKWEATERKCAFGGTALRLSSKATSGIATILIRPE